jgi:hypothetical protein
MRLLALLAAFACGPAMAQKLDARLDCRHTGKDFIYNCTIKLARGGEPLSGAQIMVDADMPSMPMAHHVRPVKAQPTKTPGEYRARLDLEMPGQWAVKLRLSQPVRDLLVVHYEFTETGTAPQK